MSRPRMLVAWSSGKDSAWMLSALQARGEHEIAGLLTTFNAATAAVAMHEVPRPLVEAQARAAGLPLWPVLLPWPCSNAVYAARMSAALARARREGVDAIAFGDLFLEDIRDYRVRQLEGSGVAAHFPIWCGPEATAGLARTMCDAGLRATVTCVDAARLDASYVGREFDHGFLDALPAGVDPCGEYGEFHTFCTAAPCFAAPIAVTCAAPRLKDGFIHCTVQAARPGGHA